MKIIAMYLPQFHRVKENDEWWGEGFTEWTTVKNAIPLYEGHYQPRFPRDNNYYDLLQKETMEWQASLMNQYGVDGMCIYHYWFKDGRQILEKPVENLLNWKEINMPFCFCWANETWARSWSKISSKNSWANTFETERDDNNNGILLEQKYGGMKEWKQHYEYLLPFFKDDRYIKIDNKPVFVIYKTSLIVCLQEMIENWNDWAIESGFDGIYIIGANTNYSSKDVVDKVLIHEPQHIAVRTTNSKKGRRDLLRIDYRGAWCELLEGLAEKGVIYGSFVGYDDTPRRGKEGVVFEGQTPELFKQYLTELLAKNEVNNSPFTFINAWNEWGEGMYLEPDEKDGYAYLEAISYAKEHYRDYIEKYKRQLENINDGLLKEYNALSEKCAKYEDFWRILDALLCFKEEGISLESYFVNQGIKTIAIYGGGMLGNHLLEGLKNSGVKVVYIIDRRADSLNMKLPVYSPEDELPKVDAVIVSATFAYKEIKKILNDKGFKVILSLKNILTELE